MKRPDWQIALFDRCLPILGNVTAKILTRIPNLEDDVTVEHVNGLTDHEAIVTLCGLLSRELYDATPPYHERVQVCGWCVQAAGDTQEAQEAAVKFSLAEIREHAQICDHNPVVAHAFKLKAKLDRYKLALEAAADELGCPLCGNPSDEHEVDCDLATTEAA